MSKGGAYGVTTVSDTDLLPSNRKSPSPYWKLEGEKCVNYLSESERRIRFIHRLDPVIWEKEKIVTKRGVFLPEPKKDEKLIISKVKAK